MVEIRALSHRDGEAYWRIRLEALEAEPLAFGSSAEEHRAEGMEAIVAERLRDMPGGGFMLGAFDEGRLVGIVGFVRSNRVKNRHTGGIVAMYVAPEARGRGIGRRLLVALLDRVRTYEGLERVGLTVTTQAEAARRLYLSLGFVPWGVEPEAIKYQDRYADMEHMVLVLDKPVLTYL